MFLYSPLFHVYQCNDYVSLRGVLISSHPSRLPPLPTTTTKFNKGTTTILYMTTYGCYNDSSGYFFLSSSQDERRAAIKRVLYISKKRQFFVFPYVFPIPHAKAYI